MTITEPATLATDYLLAALIQQAGWDPAPWFNHNDLYRVVQALAIWLFYLGGRRLGAPPGRLAVD